MGEITQYWEQFLYTTGGALALDKYFFVALDWCFDKDVYRPYTQEETKIDIALLSGNNYLKTSKISHASPSVGNCTFGVWLAADGGQHRRY